MAPDTPGQTPRRPKSETTSGAGGPVPGYSRPERERPSGGDPDLRGDAAPFHAAEAGFDSRTDTLHADIIGRLYDVALDPVRLDDLLDDWERLQAPLQRAQERAGGGVSDHDTPMRRMARLYRKTRRPSRPPVPDLTDHFRRVAALLAQTQVTRTLRPEEVELARFARTAAFAVAPSLRIASANRAAQVSLSAQQGRSLDTLPFDEADRLVLASRIRQLLAETSASQGRATLLRLRRHGSDRIVLLHLSVVRPGDAPAFVVVVTSELRWPETLNRTLRDAFALTPAEIEILRALSEGRSLRDIAHVRDRSIETVRAQIKAILSKTETTSQNELLRLTLTIMEVVPDGANEIGAISGQALPRLADIRISRATETLEERPFHVLIRPDGRRVEYLLLGDPKGRPVLFTHGALGLCRWPGALERQAQAAGICVVVPVRPGYGASTPLPSTANRRQEVVRDMAALMDRLGIASVPVLTLDLDVHYIAHLHARCPGRVKALIAVGGTLPLTARAQYERMGRWHLFIRAGARYTPALYPFMVQAGIAMQRRLGRQGWLRKIFAESAADRALADRPEAFEAIDVGMDIMMREGFDAATAFTEEVMTSERVDWRAEIDAMRDKVPIHFLHGDDDLQMVAETRRELAQEYPWITFHLIPNAGQLLLFQAGEIALTWLRKYQ
tara:strand:- start:27790 stop:29805 length:2016 start_codon:yes stop_codon:yes gene_type:complete